ncbi:MAG: hypothetical protein ACOC3V_01635 [bacterium]
MKSKENDKKNKTKKQKLLKKPTTKLIKELDAVKTAMKGETNTRFVKKGKTGFFNFDEEYENQRNKWLGGKRK